ncbi:MAG: hypothetical protein ACYTE5_11315 [Planctomycetota bacterium]|jgi:hypothetical protein
MADEPSEKTPIDGEFGLDYQIHILRLMVSELPDGIRKPILDQIDEIVKAVAVRQKLLVSLILPQLEDLRVDIQYMEFDRQAVQGERDDALERLKEILGDDFQI